MEVKKNLPKMEDNIFKMPIKLECSQCNMEFQSQQKIKSEIAKYQSNCKSDHKIEKKKPVHLFHDGL